MAGQKAKGGKKNRKHGRNKKSPAMQRYVAEGRAEKNKKGPSEGLTQTLPRAAVRVVCSRDEQKASGARRACP